MKLAHHLFGIWLLCLGLCFPSFLHADPLADHRFSHLGTPDGLGERVLDIEQDRLGFMWFATRTGLHQYDGSRLVTYRHSSRDTRSISDSYVRRLLNDSEGNLWAATESGHLNRWIPEEERFQQLTVDLGGPVTELVEVSPGRFLVGVDWLRTLSVSARDGTAARLSHLDGVQGLQVDTARQAIWGFGEQGVARYAIDDFTLQREIPWPADLAAPNPLFLGVTLAEDGSLWAAAYTGGAVHFQPDTEDISVFRHVPGNPGTLTGNDLTAVHQDTSGTVWIAGFSGWNRFLPSSKTFERFTSSSFKDRGLANHQLHAIFEDRTGQLWVGTDAGVARFDPLREGFRFYSHDPTRDLSAPPGGIRSFAEDDVGRLWVGSRNHGIARLNRQGGSALYFSAESSRGDPMPDNTAWDLSYEAPDRLWVGSEAGLLQLQISSGTWRQFIPQGTLAQRVVTLYRDQNQTLWAGGQYGVYRYDPIANALQHVDFGFQARVTALLDDAAGRLLVGTDGQGIVVLDREDGRRLNHWPGNSTAKWQLTHGTVTALRATRRGGQETIWATTLDGGLHRLDADDKWTRLGSGQSLPSEAVVALQAQPDGTLWLSTGVETFRFEPESGAVQRFQVADGFPTLVNKEASYQSPSGELFFGGIDGFVAFMPDDVVIDTKPPRVVLTDLQIGNRSMLPRAQQPESPLQTSITLAESVTLRHRQNDFTLEFAALHFGDPASNRFSYRLEGIDSDWIERSAERSFARYSQIPAGRHLFRVKAANRDGFWSEEAQLWVRVLPPPWRSWWAWTLYALSALGLVVWWTQTRTARLRLEKELQEQELKVLRGLLPICATCKKIRDDEGEWEPLEAYLTSHSDAQLTHGICPTCAERILGHPVK